MPVEIDRLAFETLLEEARNIGVDRESKRLYLRHEKVESKVWKTTEALHIQKVGCINLPASLKDVEAIRDVYLSGKGGCKVSHNFITIIHKESETFASHSRELCYSMLAQMLDINFGHLRVSIESHLEELVICKGGEVCRKGLSLEKKPGTFGSFLVQVPIQVEQPSGYLAIHETEKEKIPLASNNSTEDFLAIMAGRNRGYGGRHYSICSDSEGITAVLVFSLVCPSLSGISSHLKIDYLPQFLIVAHKMAKSLLTWETGEVGSTSKLCLPVSKPSSSSIIRTHSLNQNDAVLAYLLTSINFIDISYAIIKTTKLSYVEGKITSSDITDFHWTRMLEMKHQPTFSVEHESSFQKGTLASPSAINAKTDFVGHFEPDPLRCNDIFAHYRVLIARPRNVNLVKNDSVVCAMNDLENQCEGGGCYSLTSPHRQSLLKQLDRLLDAVLDKKFSCNEGLCTPCQWRRIIQLSVRLNAVQQGLRILKKASHHQAQLLWQTCRGNGCCSTNESTTFLANLVCYVCGWEACSEAITEILKKQLGLANVYEFCRLGVGLFRRGCTEGGRLILHEVMSKFLAFTPDSWKSLRSHVWLNVIDLAVCLHEESANVHWKFLDEAIVYSANLSPLNMRYTAEYLSYMLHSYQVGCKSQLRELGFTIGRTLFKGFDSEDFLVTLHCYLRNGVDDVVKLYWEKVTSICLRINQTNSEEACLLCELLYKKEEEYQEEKMEALRSLCQFTGARESIALIIKSIADGDLEFTKGWPYAEMLRSIIVLHEGSDLVGDSKMKQLCSAVNQLDADCLFEMVAELSKPPEFVKKSDSTLSQAFEQLIEEILRKFNETCVTEPVFQAIVWFGDEHLVEKLATKVFASLEPGRRISIISGAFTALDESRASTSLMFNRNIFNMLILEWAKSIPSLEKGRADSFSECFQFLIESEKSFIDSAGPDMLTAFQSTIKCMSFEQAAKITVGVFSREIKDPGPNLKKFPLVWQVFSSLCNTVISQEDLSTSIKALAAEEIALLMLSFFWLAEEKPIVELSRVIINVPFDNVSLFEIDKTVIFDARTLELASSSMLGLTALNSLIDGRFQRLTLRQTFELIERAFDRTYYRLSKVEVSRNCETYMKTNPTWRENSIIQKEMSDLHALRGKVLVMLTKREESHCS